jgi:hypothetical protein
MQLAINIVLFLLGILIAVRPRKNSKESTNIASKVREFVKNILQQRSDSDDVVDDKEIEDALTEDPSHPLLTKYGCLHPLLRSVLTRE